MLAGEFCVMGKNFHFLLKSVGIEIPENLNDALIKGICSDSRQIKEGDLFFGLPGEKVDGGIFCSQAFSVGASAAIIALSAQDYVPSSKKDLVLVAPGSVSELMGELSAVFWDRPSSKIKLIGVTGTNGKTTTTHLIEYLSSAAGRSTALFGTLVNRWPMHSAVASHTTQFGDVLNAELAKAVKAGVTIAAMEVSSHALAQKRVAGLSFSGVVFTNLTQDHLDYHESMEAYFAAKSLLFESPLIQYGVPRAVINVDDEWGRLLAERLQENCWKSSLDQENIASLNPELFISDIKMTAQGVQGVLHSPCGVGSFSSPLIGEFNLMNLLQAIGILLQQGSDLNSLLASSRSFPGVPGRMERVTASSEFNTDKGPVVLVDYAHTPEGLRNALNAVKPFVLNQLICVFGCGGDRDKSKRSKMGAIAAGIADKLIITSDNPRTEDQKEIIDDILEGITSKVDMLIEPDRASAIDFAINYSQANDVVIIAGKGHEDYQILGDEIVHFDDREVAQTALNKKYS